MSSAWKKTRDRRQSKEGRGGSERTAKVVNKGSHGTIMDCEVLSGEKERDVLGVNTGTKETGGYQERAGNSRDIGWGRGLMMCV